MHTTRSPAKIWQFVEDLVPYELKFFAINFSAGATSLLRVHYREATTEVFVPSFKRQFIAESGDWFREYTTIKLGAVHGCILRSMIVQTINYINYIFLKLCMALYS